MNDAGRAGGPNSTAAAAAEGVCDPPQLSWMRAGPSPVHHALLWHHCHVPVMRHAAAASRQLPRLRDKALSAHRVRRIDDHCPPPDQQVGPQDHWATTSAAGKGRQLLSRQRRCSGQSCQGRACTAAHFFWQQDPVCWWAQRSLLAGSTVTCLSHFILSTILLSIDLAELNGLSRLAIDSCDTASR